MEPSFELKFQISHIRYEIKVTIDCKMFLSSRIRRFFILCVLSTYSIFTLVMNSIFVHVSCVASAPEGRSALNIRQKEKGRAREREEGEESQRKK